MENRGWFLRANVVTFVVMNERVCDTCGNEISSTAGVCPFCRSPQTLLPLRKTVPRILTLNLKHGMPSADEALVRLERELESAKTGGAKLVRVIHGYGSQGKGGLIAQDTRRRLRALEAKGLVRGFIAGEDYSRGSVAGRKLMTDFPLLKDSERTDRDNPGITFVIL